jgi:hypothetical protein
MRVFENVILKRIFEPKRDEEIKKMEEVAQ